MIGLCNKAFADPKTPEKFAAAKPTWRVQNNIKCDDPIPHKLKYCHHSDVAGHAVQIRNGC